MTRNHFGTLLVVGGPLILAPLLCAQSNGSLLNKNQVVRDSHNCYPYDGRWNDRVDRALSTGFPVAIEQDLAWYADPKMGKGRVVVSHKAKTDGTEPDERKYFFERVRPIMEKALASGNSSEWPLIIVHFDFKDTRPELLHAVWSLLGEYESWIGTAPKMADAHTLAPIERKPLLVLTEDSDAQEKVFYTDLPVGAKLRLFGSAHTHMPEAHNQTEQARLAVATPPEQLLSDPPTGYRRWWNNGWGEVEEGGQTKAGAWTPADRARLQALVDHAHKMGYWIRFYTLDGFTPEQGKANGWLAPYNFGSLSAVEERWRAAFEAGVNLIATDQYEELAKFEQNIKH